MRAQGADHVVERRSPAASASASTRVDKGAQAAIVLARRMRLCGRRGDERPDAPLRLDDAGALEFGIYARDGIGVDRQIDGQLADGGQLSPGRSRPVAIAARNARSSCA